MTRKIRLSLFLCLTVLSLLAGQFPAAAEIRLTVLYDNYPAVEGVQADWGFSCLVQGAEKTILFDTGTKAAILQKNFERLGVDFEACRHDPDFPSARRPYGGARMGPFAKAGRPGASPCHGLRRVHGQGPSVGRSAATGAGAAGDLPQGLHHGGDARRLRSRFFRAVPCPPDRPGAAGHPGCAHPGIVEIVRRAAQVAPGVPRVVLGGFHLMRRATARFERLAKS